VGPDAAFHPAKIDISVGDTVRWTWGGQWTQRHERP